MYKILFMFPIFFPIIAGILLLIFPEIKDRKKIIFFTASILIITGLSVLFVLYKYKEGMILFHLTDKIPVFFKIDEISKVFVCLVSVIWILAGFSSFPYMIKEKNEKRYFGFYLLAFGILLGLDLSGNLITLYIFYEIMTLVLFPLIIHSMKKEAIMAGLKYLFYSLSGAYMALFGIFFLSKYANGWNFTNGGILNRDLVQGHQNLILVITFLMIIGFSVKAGMFPMHAWLAASHPVAPAPASAVLSGIIVKCGVLAIIRVIYFIIGADFLRGTWVQYTWLILTLITIFMGSVIAFQEPILKKRLAYSTVSQISYILFGLALMNPIGLTGALLHVIFHAIIKTALFLISGSIILRTGKKQIDQMEGIGKEMPVTIWCYTIVSLGLIGIPPMNGFISKWYLAVGSLNTRIPYISIIGVIILLISALFTAAYLLPITIKGFFPGEQYPYDLLKKKEKPDFMICSILILSVLTIVFGIIPNRLIGYLSDIAATIM